jgi:hypothetical protein
MRVSVAETGSNLDCEIPNGGLPTHRAYCLNQRKRPTPNLGVGRSLNRVRLDRLAQLQPQQGSAAQPHEGSAAQPHEGSHESQHEWQRFLQWHSDFRRANRPRWQR